MGVAARIRSFLVRDISGPKTFQRTRLALYVICVCIFAVGLIAMHLYVEKTHWRHLAKSYARMAGQLLAVNDELRGLDSPRHPRKPVEEPEKSFWEGYFERISEAVKREHD